MDDLIYINIGKEEPMAFEIRRSLLSDASPVFRRMIENVNFLEGATGVLQFPEDEVDSWRRLLVWLKSVRSRTSRFQLVPNNATTAITLIVMADKYEIEELHQVVVGALRESVGGVDQELLEFAFQNTAPKNTVRNLLIRRLMHDGSMTLSMRAKNRESPANFCQRLQHFIISTRPLILTRPFRAIITSVITSEQRRREGLKPDDLVIFRKLVKSSKD
jgi:hypothetical protein